MPPAEPTPPDSVLHDDPRWQLTRRVHASRQLQKAPRLQVSMGGGLWQTVWTGQSTGTTTAEETYDFTDVTARWVRYLGHMSDVNTFNSVTEVSVFAVP